MWVLADLVKHCERERWRRLFGTEFTGRDGLGRKVSLRWFPITIGHVCFGDVEKYGHLRCQRITAMDWRFVRSKA